jgi:minor extracellular serine protease Vpr
MFKRLLRRVSILSLTSLSLAACSPQPAVQHPVLAAESSFDWQAIFSTRPTPDSHSFFLVKLKSAPLFTSLKKESGVLTANPDLVKSLAAEQDLVLKELTAISADIKVVYRYRMLINGFAVVAPQELADKIGRIGGVAHIESAGHFARPILPKEETAAANATKTLAARNSVTFIGGTEAHLRGIRGQGMKVGIIDSGIDFTHSMLGGVGTADAFKAVDPEKPTTAFPNAKVVGGVDFVGTKYNSGAPSFEDRVPKIDANPMDEGGHGTHVAGTVAGLGDGQTTYDGVAPDAALYALKVFGADGSTNDTVVIAALEFSADPNGDGDLGDRLDVVNLSLGFGYGSGHILYSEAIRNLSLGGTSVVASGGNSGDVPYIVGSPGATDEALSVAASVDDMDHNWRFRALKFSTVDKPEILVEAIEGAITKPLAESGSIIAPLVYGGVADKDFSPELKLAIQGKIAFIDRGVVAFADKIKRAAEAGAIGVIIANNQPGDPIVMGGGDGTKYDIPGVMITKTLADELKEQMKKGDVVSEMTSPQVIEKPQLIDTMADFSSRGPRSIDGALKPEISAPGEKIISARMGGGTAGMQMSGTSMAGPHMAGVMALLRQKFPTMTAGELKSIAMGTAKTMVDVDGKRLSLSRQGAGRVQIIKALDTQVLATPSAISLGEMAIEARKVVSRPVEFVNLSATDATYDLSLQEATPGIQLSMPSPTVKLAAGERKFIDVRLTIDGTQLAETTAEISALLVANQQGAASGTESLRVPVLAVANRVARIDAESLLVRSTSAADSQGAVVDLTLKNKSTVAGQALIFNKIATDPRKEDPTLDPFRSRICDLSEAGYRVINKAGVQTLQIAAKLYEPMTTWDLCEVSVLIDKDGDREADQDLGGLRKKYVEGLTGEDYASVLVDMKSAREIRKAYEAARLAPTPTPAPSPAPSPAPVVAAPKLDFSPAIVALEPMQAFEHSTIAVLETPLSALNLTSAGTLAVRIATSAQTGSAIEPDDFLSNNPKKWRQLNLRPSGAGFVELPASVTLAGGENKNVSFTKGAGAEQLLVLYPNGRPLWNSVGSDSQSQTLRPKYSP